VRREIVVAAAVAVAVAAPAQAQTPAPGPPPGEPVAAAGVTVGGVAVGGLTREQVTEVVRESVARPLGRRLVVAVGSRRFSILPRDAGVSIKLDLLVTRAMQAAPGRNVSVVPTLRRSAAPRLLARVQRGVYVAPRNSRVLFGIRRLRASRPRDGWRLAQAAFLEDRIAATLRSWIVPRFLRAQTRRVKPRVNQRRLRAITGPIVTVSRSDKRARVFNHLRQVRSYPVATGQPAWPTPTGLFHVRSKVVNPAWSVPNSSWAGSQAGQTIPGGSAGNPLVARWIGITSAVGFHGTNNPWSIGSAASHGCIRMYPRDVIKLYVWVRIGTPVFIR
jgi:lipoprotein-anchoring transpeptidase ErfK/SrfK